MLISFDTLVHLSSVLQHIDRLGINFILIWSGLMVAFPTLIRGQCLRFAQEWLFWAFFELSWMEGYNRNTRLASPQVKVYFSRNRMFKMSARMGGLKIVKNLRTSYILSWT